MHSTLFQRNLFCRLISVDAWSILPLMRRAGTADRRANRAVTAALASGELVAASDCEFCGASPLPDRRLSAHHDLGYEPDFWLEVIWCCSRCHKLRHYQNEMWTRHMSAHYSDNLGLKSANAIERRRIQWLRRCHVCRKSNEHERTLLTRDATAKADICVRCALARGLE